MCPAWSKNIGKVLFDEATIKRVRAHAGGARGVRRGRALADCGWGTRACAARQGAGSADYARLRRSALLRFTSLRVAGCAWMGGWSTTAWLPSRRQAGPDGGPAERRLHVRCGPAPVSPARQRSARRANHAATLGRAAKSASSTSLTSWWCLRMAGTTRAHKPRIIPASTAVAHRSACYSERVPNVAATHTAAQRDHVERQHQGQEGPQRGYAARSDAQLSAALRRAARIACAPTSFSVRRPRWPARPHPRGYWRCLPFAHRAFAAASATVVAADRHTRGRPHRHWPHAQVDQRVPLHEALREVCPCRMSPAAALHAPAMPLCSSLRRHGSASKV